MENTENDVENSLCTKRRKLTSKIWEDFTYFEAENGKEWEQLVIKQHQMNHLNVTRAIIKYGFSTLNSIKPDIFHVYLEEKEKLRRYFPISCRFSITVNYFEDFFLTVLHLIDDNWKLQKKILSFNHLEKGNFSNIFKGLLSDWKIGKNICSIVVADTDDVINQWFSKQASLPFAWQLVSVSWLVDSLKPSPLAGANWERGKMRKCFDYVINSSNEQKFLIAVDKVKTMGKKVTSRNIPLFSLAYSFEELEIGVGFKEAFCELEQMDPDFQSINLTIEEWDRATKLYGCLKVLNEAARSLSESKYTTANVYFPRVCDIYKKLLLWEKSENFHVQQIAWRASKSFIDIFWRNSRLVLATAVIFDPRFKMDIVKRWYTEIYGSDAGGYLMNIIDDVTNIYSKYVNASNKMLDEMGRPCTSPPNSELCLYLKEPKIPSVEEFDILAWWHSNTPNFPVLATMARDILAVPISPAAFSDDVLKRSEIENIIYCTGLDDDIKQALVCTKSWLSWLRSCEDN